MARLRIIEAKLPLIGIHGVHKNIFTLFVIVCDRGKDNGSLCEERFVHCGIFVRTILKSKEY
jgi:hypothetical protein